MYRINRGTEKEQVHVWLCGDKQAEWGKKPKLKLEKHAEESEEDVNNIC